MSSVAPTEVVLGDGKKIYYTGKNEILLIFLFSLDSSTSPLIDVGVDPINFPRPYEILENAGFILLFISIFIILLARCLRYL